MVRQQNVAACVVQLRSAITSPPARPYVSVKLLSKTAVRVCVLVIFFCVSLSLFTPGISHKLFLRGQCFGGRLMLACV